MNLENLLITEKYRPKKLEDMILPDRIKSIFKNGITDNYIFYGHFGTGKTSLARILIGTYVLSSGYYDAYYLKAQKVRKLIKNDFDEVYKRTNTSYKPYPSGNSDYKSASSVERIEAFIALGRKDPVQYEDETGEVDYEVAKSHVKQVLAEYE